MESEDKSKKIIEEQINCLKNKIKESIDDASRKTRQNKIKASIIKVVSLLLSATVTILIGWNSNPFRELMNNIALTFASMVTLLSAIEPFFNYRALWIEHEEATWRFYSIRDDLEFYLAGRELSDVDRRELAEFHSRLRHTWDELSKKWLKFRRTESEYRNETIDRKELQE